MIDWAELAGPAWFSASRGKIISFDGCKYIPYDSMSMRPHKSIKTRYLRSSDQGQHVVSKLREDGSATFARRLRSPSLEEVILRREV